MNSKDFDALGLPGPSQIRSSLLKTRKPNTLVNAITKFQNDNSIKSESIKPALKLLQLLEIPRSTYYQKVVTNLSDVVALRIRQLGAEKTRESIEKLQQQLERCFSLYKVSQFRPIVLETLNQIKDLPQKYLDAIVADPDLYKDCGVSVRQQIWACHFQLFDEAVQPVIDDYISAKQRVLCATDGSTTNFFTCETTKTRRQWQQVQTLISMVGEREQLYARLLSLIRTRFAASSSPLFCSLRIEVLMAAHDANVDFCVKNDACHPLAWLLDACVRDKHLDSQMIGKIRTVLDVKKGGNELLGDMAMLAADPYVVHFVCSMMLRALRDTSQLPRDLASVQLLARLLSLGCHAHALVTSSEPPSQLVDPTLPTVFLPALASLILEDNIRTETGGVFVDVGDEQMNLLHEPSAAIVDAIRTEMPAALLWLHYSLEAVSVKRRGGDVRAALRYLRLLPALWDKLALRSPWCHLLMHRVLHLGGEAFWSDAECSHLMIDRLLLEGVETEGVRFQLLRLVNQAFVQLGLPRSKYIMDLIAPIVLFGDKQCVEREQYTVEFDKTMVRITPRPVAPPPPPPQQGEEGAAPQATPHHAPAGYATMTPARR